MFEVVILTVISILIIGSEVVINRFKHLKNTKLLYIFLNH